MNLLENRKKYVRNVLDNIGTSEDIYCSISVASMLQDELQNYGKTRNVKPSKIFEPYGMGKPYFILYFISNEKLKECEATFKKDFPDGIIEPAWIDKIVTLGVRIFVDPMLDFNDTNIYTMVSKPLIEIDVNIEDII